MLTRKKRGRGRPRKYNWDEWLGRRDGEWFELVHGKDFHCQVSGFVQQVRSRALRHGTTVSVSVRDDTIVCIKVIPY